MTYKHTKAASYTGYIVQAIVNNFAPLLFVIFRNRFGFSLSQITLIITINFLIQLCVDMLSAKFVDKIGLRPCVTFAHFSAAVGLLGLAVLPFVFPDAYVGLLISVVFYAVGGGLIEVVVSPIIEACPSDNKAADMSLLHSFYCWGSVAVIIITTGAIGVFGDKSWPVVAAAWAIIPIINGITFLRVPFGNTVTENERVPLKKLLTNGKFLLFLIFMLGAGASELAMSQWASLFAENGLGVSKAVGDIAGPCFFALLMGISRVMYVKCSHKTELTRYIAVSCIVCACGFLLAAFSPVPWLALIGCGVCGFGVGILWPGTYSLGSRAFPNGGTAMFALMAFAGDAGCTTGPTIVGLISDASGGNVKNGMIIGAAFPIIMFICLMIYKKSESREKKIKQSD